VPDIYTPIEKTSCDLCYNYPVIFIKIDIFMKHLYKYTQYPAFEYIKQIMVLAFIAYYAFISFPEAYSPIQPGLDASWMYGINYLANSGHVLDKDVYFSYGPLGFLLYPLNIGLNIPFGLLFRLIIYALLLIILIYFLFRLRIRLPVFLFVLVLILQQTTQGSFAYEYLLVWMVGLLICIYLVKGSPEIKYVGLPVAALLASAALFIKLNMGITTASMLGMVGLILVIKDRSKLIQYILFCLLPYLVFLGTLAWTYLDSTEAMINWIRASLNIMDGYGAVMGTEGPVNILMMGIGSIILLYLILFIFKVKGSSLVYPAVVFSLPLFLAFKHGFCRQDVHSILFFLFASMVAGTYILLSNIKRDVVKSMLVFLVIFIFYLFTCQNYNSYSLSNALNVLSGRYGANHLEALTHIKTTLDNLDLESRKNLASEKLPDEWAKSIKGSGGTIDVIPWEISYCPANHFDWSPNPTMQLYAAYTAYLDNISAMHYGDNKAPQFVLAQFYDIDGRNPLLANPASWRNVINNYNLVYSDTIANRFLFEKKSHFEQQTAEEITRITSKFNTWIDVPDSGNLLTASMDLRLNFMGGVVKTLLKIPAVYIDLQFDSGREIRYRIIPDNAKNGLLINYLPIDSISFNDLLSGTAKDRVARYKISGPGTNFYINDYTIIINQLDREIWYKSAKFSISGIKIINATTRFNIDMINGVVFKGDDLLDEKTDQKALYLSGWAIDDAADKCAGGIYACIDNELDIEGVYGLPRPDVAQYLKNENYKNSGFSISIPLKTIAQGKHTITLKILTANHRHYYAPDQQITFILK